MNTKLHISFSGRDRVVAEINNSGIRMVDFTANLEVTEKGFETLQDYFSHIRLVPTEKCPAPQHILDRVIGLTIEKFKHRGRGTVASQINPFFDIKVEVIQSKAA